MPYNDRLFCDNVLSNDNITSHGVFKQKMKPPVDLRIVTAEKGDEERILKFLQSNFYVEEPTSVCLKRLPKTVEECKPLKYLPEGHSFIAIDASDESKDNIVGVILNHEVRASDLAEFNRLIKENENNTYGEIIKILAKLDTEGDVWNRIGVEKAFSTSIVSVKKSYRGLNIGKKLMERSLERARSCNYTHAMVECSSFYSAQFVASLGFELFHEILYKDYLNDNGQVVFPVSKPHEAIKKYVKRL